MYPPKPLHTVYTVIRVSTAVTGCTVYAYSCNRCSIRPLVCVCVVVVARAAEGGERAREKEARTGAPVRGDVDLTWLRPPVTFSAKSPATSRLTAGQRLQLEFGTIPLRARLEGLLHS